jgi:hypothetical protein
MKTLTIFGMVLSTSLATASFASDDAYPEAAVLPEASDVITDYRRAGEWMIYANETRGTCFMTQVDDFGGAVQMGITKSGEYGYIGLFVKGAEVEEGIKDIVISVNDNIYVGESNSATHLADDYEGGYIISDNTQLRYDLGKAEELYAFPDAPYMVTVDLKGARNAIFEVRKCTSELQES